MRYNETVSTLLCDLHEINWYPLISVQNTLHTVNGKFEMNIFHAFLSYIQMSVNMTSYNWWVVYTKV